MNPAEATPNTENGTNLIGTVTSITTPAGTITPHGTNLEVNQAQNQDPEQRVQNANQADDEVHDEEEGERLLAGDEEGQEETNEPEDQGENVQNPAPEITEIDPEDQEELEAQPINNPNDIKYAWHLEGYLWGQMANNRDIISNFKNAVDNVTQTFIFYFLIRAFEDYDPKDPKKAQPSFESLLYCYIIRWVLSMLDITYILCVNYRSRESPIIILSVLVNLSFYIAQLLAIRLNPAWVRTRIVDINIIFLVLIFLLSCFSKDRIPIDPRNPGPRSRTYAADKYCKSRSSDFIIEFLIFTRALGPYSANWLYVLFPITSIYAIGLLVLVIVFFFALYQAVFRRQSAFFGFFFVGVVACGLGFPFILFIYYLNGFEKSGEHRQYLVYMVWFFLIINFLNGATTIRVRQYIANDELREAIMRQRANLAGNGAQNQEQEEPVERTPMERVGDALAYLPVGGNYFTRQDSNVEEHTRRRETGITAEVPMCGICFEKPANTIYLPCRHGGFCADCSREVFHRTGKCPLCRSRLERINIFERRDGVLYKTGNIM